MVVTVAPLFRKPSWPLGGSRTHDLTGIVDPPGIRAEIGVAVGDIERGIQRRFSETHGCPRCFVGDPDDFTVIVDSRGDR